MTLESLRALQKRIREATGADRELDFDIGDLIKIPPHEVTPHYTTDPDGLGACVALQRAVLPEALCFMHQFNLKHFYVEFLDQCERTLGTGRHEFETRARLLGIFSAVISEEEAKEKADV